VPSMAIRPGSSLRTDALGRAYQGTTAHVLRAVDLEHCASLRAGCWSAQMEEQLPRLEASETEDVVQSIEEGINDVPPGEPPPEER
jgi:hypothetical protein